MAKGGTFRIERHGDVIRSLILENRVDRSRESVNSADVFAFGVGQRIPEHGKIESIDFCVAVDQV